MGLEAAPLDHPGWGNLADALADTFGPRGPGGRRPVWVHPHDRGGHSPLYLRIIHLMRDDGRPLREIAATMGVTVTAVWAALRRPVCCRGDE